MALIKCSHCWKPISDKVTKCPKCGAENIVDKPQSFGEKSARSRAESPTNIQDEEAVENDVELDIEPSESHKFSYWLLGLIILAIVAVGIRYF